MKQPLITTIIPTYRRPVLLKKAIQSVLSQTYPAFQLWILDNASGDETAEVVREFSKRDNRVKYHCHPTNIGMMGNYQSGLSFIDTTYFSFLSDDDVLLPDFYATCIEEFKNAPDAGFVAASTIILTTEGRFIRIPVAEWEREGRFEPPEGLLSMIGKFPVPTSILFHRRVLDTATINFDNSLFWDCDYLLQIGAALPIVISKKPCALFLHHPSSFSNQHNFSYHQESVYKLIESIRKNPRLSPEIISEAENRIIHTLHGSYPFFVVYFIKEKQFDTALEIAQMIRGRFNFYLLFAKTCKRFPFAIYGFYFLRWIKRFILSIKHRKINKFLNEESARQTALPTNE